MTRLYVTLVCLGAVALPTRSAWAAVEIGDVRVGYEGHARSSSTAPVAIDLTNPDSKDVRGVLSVRVPIPGSQPTIWSREVEMPSGGHKRVLLYPRLSEDVGYGPTAAETEVIFQPADGAAVVKALSARMHEADTVLILVCTEGAAGAYSFAQTIDTTQWAGAPSPAVPGGPVGAGAPGGRSEVVVAYTNTESLPDSWKGFDGLDLLVMDDFSPAVLTEPQEAAVLDWVSMGGRLLVTGGEDWRRISDSFLRDYLPIDVRATEVLEGGLTGLGGALGVPIDPTPTAIVVGPAVRGTVWASEGDRALVAAANYGLGRVWLATFAFTKHPVKGWPGASALLSRILAAGRVFPPGLVTSGSRAEAAGGLASNGGAKPPSFRVVGIFLLAYVLFLIPVNYLVLSRLKKRELAWVTTPCIVVLFSIAAYALGFFLRGGSLIVRDVGVVEVQGSTGAGQAVGVFSLFSPSRKDYAVGFGPASLDLDAPAFGRSRYGGPGDPPKLASPFEVRAGEGDSIHKLLVQMWDQRLFAARGPVVLAGPLEGTLRLAGGSLNGELRNATGLTLRDAILVFRREAHPLGEIADGATIPVSLSGAFAALPSPPPPGGFEGRSTTPQWMHGGMPSTPQTSALAQLKMPEVQTNPLKKEYEPLHEALHDGYLNGSSYQMSDQEAVVLGWSDSAALEATVNGREVSKGSALSLVAIHLAVQGP